MRMDILVGCVEPESVFGGLWTVHPEREGGGGEDRAVDETERRVSAGAERWVGTPLSAPPHIMCLTDWCLYVQRRRRGSTRRRSRVSTKKRSVKDRISQLQDNKAVSDFFVCSRKRNIGSGSRLRHQLQRKPLRKCWRRKKSPVRSTTMFSET